MNPKSLAFNGKRNRVLSVKMSKRKYPERPQRCPVCENIFVSTFRDRPAPYGKCWKTYCSYRCNTLKNGPRGESHYLWKGDNVGYQALHDWIMRHWDRPKECQKCGNAARIEAANISGSYKRDRSDWIFLCKRCHNIMDKITTRRNSLGQFDPEKPRNPFVPTNSHSRL